MKKIALVCTGTSFPNDTDVKQVQQYLAEYRCDTVYNADTYSKLPAEQRAKIFLNYLFDREIDIIWAMRGGEGTADILPYIHQQYANIAKLPEKLLIGFSDFTPILIYFAQKFNWRTCHGPGAFQLPKDKIDIRSKQHILDLILEQKQQVQLSNLTNLNRAADQQTTITASVCGGNLSLLNISIHDIWQMQCENKIVIIEDVSEKAHAIFRTLKYLSRIKFFKNIKALIFGDFISTPIGCDLQQQIANKQAIQRTLATFALNCPFPVLATNKVGHGRQNHPVLFAPSKLSLGTKAQLVTTL